MLSIAAVPVIASRVSAAKLSAHDLTGTISLKRSGTAKRGFEEFLKAKLKGVLSAEFVSNSSEDARGSMSLVVTFSGKRAGAACVSLTGTATDAQQKYAGTFKVLGGTGDAARLHASGKFRAVQPKAFDNHYQMALFTSPSLGSKRGMPSSCGKPPPSCGPGATLYEVYDYSGPSDVVFDWAVFGPVSGTGTVPATQGQVAIPTITGPPDGSYSSKDNLRSTKGEALSGMLGFGGNVVLQRGC